MEGGGRWQGLESPLILLRGICLLPVGVGEPALLQRLHAWRRGDGERYVSPREDPWAFIIAGMEADDWIH